MCVEPSHQIRAGYFQTYILIYGQFLRAKFHIFLYSETTENYSQNFRIFSLPKIRFSKTIENHTKKFSLLFLPKNQCVQSNHVSWTGFVPF